MITASVLGLGIFHPENTVGNDAWPEEFVTRARHTGDRTLLDIPIGLDEAGRISAEYLAKEACDPFIGATVRREAEPTLFAHQAETYAAQAALKDAGIEAADIDVILSYGVVPDRVAPNGGYPVAHALGAVNAFVMGIDIGCNAGIGQLMLAKGLVESGQAKHVLLTQSHLLTRAFAKMHPASPGIGDCATAVVVSATPRHKIRAVYARTHGEYYDAVIWMRGRDPQVDTPWWKAGGDYYIGSMKPENTKRLMQDTVAFGAQTVRELMTQAKLDVERIDTLVSVQPRGWVPEAIARCLGLPAGTAVGSYDRYAHLGACGPFVNLALAKEAGRFEQGGFCALYAQGSGFSRGAALLEMSAD